MRLNLILLVALSLVAACAPKPPEGPPVAVQPSFVESQLYWSSELSGKMVSIDGFVFLDNGEDGKAIAMGPELSSAPSGGGERLIRFDAKRGDKPNQLNMPVIKTRKMVEAAPAAGEVVTVDFGRATYQDASGVAHPIADEIRVTGRLEYVRLGGGLLTEDDPRSPTGKRFKPRLVDVTLEPAT